MKKIITIILGLLIIGIAYPAPQSFLLCGCDYRFLTDNNNYKFPLKHPLQR